MIESFDQFDWLLPLTLALLGLAVGSFLNVVIYRLPLMMEARWRRECCELLEVEPARPTRRLSLSYPNSHCPVCRAPVRPWHNIPVASYILLGGRCADCGCRISIRYPLVELATCVMTLTLASHFPLSLSLIGAMLLSWALIALTLIDVDHQLLPDDITLPLLWLGLAFNLGGTYATLTDAVIGAMAGYGILWSVYWMFKLLTGKEGMGFGDFKLLAALGAWLGWQAIPLVILISSVVGALFGIALMVIKRHSRENPMPFGPYLAAAGWIALLWGDAITSGYLAAFGIR